MKGKFILAKKGFTIIELLISMVITVILVAILLQVTTMSSDTLVSAKNKVDLSRKAARVFEIMESDINSMVIRRDGNDWFYAGQPTDQTASQPNYLARGIGDPLGMNLGANGAMTRPPVTNDFSFPNTCAMVFYSAPVDRYDGLIGTAEDAGGDVSLIEYELDYRSIINTFNSSDESDIDINARPTLFRWIEFPDKAFSVLGDDLTISDGNPTLLEIFHSAGGSLSVNKQQGLSVVSSQIYSVTTSYTVAWGGAAPGVGQIMLQPVEGPSNAISASAIRISGNGQLKADATEYFEPTGTASASRERYLDEWVPRVEFPGLRITGVTVTLTLLDEQGIDYLDLVASGSISGNAVSMTKEELINRHGQTFSRHIQFPEY